MIAIKFMLIDIKPTFSSFPNEPLPCVHLPLFQKPVLFNQCTLHRSPHKEYYKSPMSAFEKVIRVKPNAGFFKDLEMWKQFSANWNGACFFLSYALLDAECLELHTDISGTIGLGGGGRGGNGFREHRAPTTNWDNLELVLPGRNSFP